MKNSWAARARRALLGASLLAAAWGLHWFRAPVLISSWFDESPVPAHGPRAHGHPASWPVADRVRVVVLDGLRKDVAETLPNLSAMCKIELTLDSGFPTVSLAVQHALWTGLSQQQSGIQYRTTLIDPPPPGIPAMVPSRAVAESHPEIIHSFGFGEAWPPLEGEDKAWADAGFIAAAAEMVASDAPLVLVHVLRIDRESHNWGGKSKQAADAATQADAWLAQLLAAEKTARPGGGTRWFVLSDHGHRAAGGHGDAEPEVRFTRLCIGGDVPPLKAEKGTTIHLVDLSRAIADSLGVSLPERAMGRPLEAAVGDPQPGATLPKPNALRWVLAFVVLLIAGWSTVWAARAARSTLTSLPIWWVVAVVCLIVRAGWPTLSNDMVWRPGGKIMLQAALPGVIVLLAALFLAFIRRARAIDVTVGQLALPTGAALVTLILAGGVESLTTGSPPLAPYYSGASSAALLILVIGVAAVGLALLVTSGPGWIGRSEEPDSSDTSG